MKSFFLYIFFFLFSIQLSAQESYMYRLILKDKGNSSCSLNNPQEFLSVKAIERRQKQGISIDATDLPIDTAYFSAIHNTGATIRTSSKWVNTVVVHVPDLHILPALEQLSFIDTLYRVWKGNLSPLTSFESDSEPEHFYKESDDDVNSYGKGYHQIHINNGQQLHEAGFCGKGMSIAVIDGGFKDADKITAFDQNRIREVKNFSHNNADPLRIETQHGTRVLSCMLSNDPGRMVGTAPEADYYLYLTEVSAEEYPVEEDYWISALEYADSIGIDVVNTSLGYSKFDDPEMDHTQDQLDGKIIPASRAAAMAMEKGMLLFIAAGNEGSNSWEKITVPSDARHVLTVGSVNAQKERSSFSSVGPAAAGRIKPDIMAMGGGTAIIESGGNVIVSDGTSYACPVIAGLGACLWQALPDLTSLEIARLIRENSDRYAHSDSLYGYGIPDVYQAYKGTGSGVVSLEKHAPYMYVDWNENRLYVNMSSLESGSCRLIVFSSLGNKLIDSSPLTNSIDIGFLPKGVYIAYLQIGQNQYVRKFIKI